MGVSVAQAAASIVGTKYVAEGPLLITHWGMSGPAILKLSSIAARRLHEVAYNFEVAINWSNNRSEEELRELIVSCLLYTSPSPRDQRGSRMPSSA